MENLNAITFFTGIYWLLGCNLNGLRWVCSLIFQKILQNILENNKMDTSNVQEQIYVHVIFNWYSPIYCLLIWTLWKYLLPILIGCSKKWIWFKIVLNVQWIDQYVHCSIIDSFVKWIKCLNRAQLSQIHKTDGMKMKLRWEITKWRDAKERERENNILGMRTIYGI